MRRLLLAVLAATTFLEGCSLGPVLPEGCDKLAMSEMRRQACESRLTPGWARHNDTTATTEPDANCRRTIGGMECYAPR